jgi:hypothetical protein
MRTSKKQAGVSPRGPGTAAGLASAGTGKGSATGWLSFRRIVDIPFDACVAALHSRLRGRDSELDVGGSRLRGPLEHDPGSGTCRVQVRLARGAAAAAAVHAAEHRLLVLPARQRARAHPLRARPGHRELLPGRPPPAGLADLLAPARRANPGARPARRATVRSSSLHGVLATCRSQPSGTSRPGALAHHGGVSYGGAGGGFKVAWPARRLLAFWVERRAGPRHSGTLSG